jgi:hypothetical protein
MTFFTGMMNGVRPQSYQKCLYSIRLFALKLEEGIALAISILAFLSPQIREYGYR